MSPTKSLRKYDLKDPSSSKPPRVLEKNDLASLVNRLTSI
uniref:Uncharacterized protein n=1 Tax=Moniliophthora roreri TaxID=221103 RepID=A0A0W0F8X7_MONRR